MNGPAPWTPCCATSACGCARWATAAGRGLVWQQRDLPSAARADRLDVFFSPAYSCPLALAVPRVTAVHDLSFFSYPSDFAVAEALRRRVTVAASVRASAAVLACSDFSAREIAARFPDAASRVAPRAPGPRRRPAPGSRRDGGPGAPRPRRPARADRGHDPEPALPAHPAPGHAPTCGAVGPTSPSTWWARTARTRRSTSTSRRRAPGPRRSGVASWATSARPISPSATPPPTSRCSCPSTRASACPPSRPPRAACPWWSSDRPALREVFAQAALLVDPRDAEAVAAAVSRAPGATRALRDGPRSLAGRELGRTPSPGRAAAELTRARSRGRGPPRLQPRRPSAVVVVSWNSREDLVALPGLARPGELPLEVVVVDNASADGSADAARATAPQAHRHRRRREPRVLASLQPGLAGEPRALRPLPEPRRRGRLRAPSRPSSRGPGGAARRRRRRPRHRERRRHAPGLVRSRPHAPRRVAAAAPRQRSAGRDPRVLAWLEERDRA